MNLEFHGACIILFECECKSVGRKMSNLNETLGYETFFIFCLYIYHILLLDADGHCNDFHL